MLNYLKFATYQIFSFSCSIPKLNKIKKNPDNFTNKEIYDFLHKQAKKSLKLVNINLTINGKENIPNQPVLFICNHASMLDSFILFASVDRPIGCVVADEPVWRSMPIVSSWAKLTKCVYINRQDNREGLKSIKYSSLLPFNPQGTMGLHNQFMKDLSEGLYNGYNLDGGLVNNTLLNPLLNKNLDKIIVISMKHDYTLPDEIKNICNEDNIIIVRPKTVFDKNDTLRFEKEFCKQIYYEGYEMGKNLNISM